jgi:hypothetical protein
MKVPFTQADLGDPLCGPVYLALSLLDDVYHQASRAQAASPPAGCLGKLAQHILSKPKPFKDWTQAILDRLAKKFPAKRTDRDGRPIPREALDPDCKVDPKKADELLAAYLKQLDYQSNPFLRSPEEMIQGGFQGVPYTLSSP